ncbi:hypothetical protein [Phytoactinopolyspora mesophila]|uniref:Uncharacterized protein n=1 Tax=Phytoactinopolyspora mesophila TaxID=2650750 RepID=A0A7K3M5J7_9ACTN|nr:hypothetical protein [Phytoactinopolyspora mesophila]NDL58583.1 hypothetical protein [Phytoactinopolyspora mesophila]
MRWTRLFADVEAQLDEADRLELEGEVADRIRSERKTVQLVDRLRLAGGNTLDVRVAGAGIVRGVLHHAGSDWFMLDGESGGELLVPLAAALVVSGAGTKAAVAVEGRPVIWSMGLRYALSVISRDRSHVHLTLTDGSALAGTIDVVGADFIDLTPRSPEERRGPRHDAAASVSFGGIAVIRRT